jgi:hypothetical protein
MSLGLFASSVPTRIERLRKRLAQEGRVLRAQVRLARHTRHTHGVARWRFSRRNVVAYALHTRHGHEAIQLRVWEHDLLRE